VSPQAHLKDLTISTSIAADLPPADTDPERITQILRNLLHNAITYTPPEGHITVDVQQADNNIQFSVVDTGAGIAPEHLPYVFERFYRADKSRTRATGGAGLGLAIVKYLVEALGGQVHVESALGKGTKVTFTAPIASYPENQKIDDDIPPSRALKTAQSN
jgi:signal transduction histidine kinase